jgi:hypothetical protein
MSVAALNAPCNPRQTVLIDTCIVSYTDLTDLENGSGLAFSSSEGEKAVWGILE